MRHPNETMIRSSYDAASTGDLQPILDILSDEIRWNVSGDSALAGDYNGKDAVLRFFGAIARQYDNTLNVQVREVLVNDHHAVALTAESGTVDGHQLEWTSGTSSRSSAPRASGWTGVREMFVQKTGLSTGAGRRAAPTCGSRFVAVVEPVKPPSADVISRRSAVWSRHWRSRQRSHGRQRVLGLVRARFGDYGP